MNALQDQVQFIIEMSTEMEAELGIGLVRNEEYIGFYLNLTAWNNYTTSNVIPLSLRKGSKMISIFMISLQKKKIFHETLFKQKK